MVHTLNHQNNRTDNDYFHHSYGQPLRHTCTTLIIAWSSQMGNPLMNESFLFNNPGFLTMLMRFGRFWRFYCKYPNRSKSFSMGMGFWEHLLWCIVNHAAKAMFQSCFKFQTKNTNIWWAFQTQDQSHFFRADGHVPSTFHGVNMLGLATCKNRKYTYNQRLFCRIEIQFAMGELRMIGPQNDWKHMIVQFYIQPKKHPVCLDEAIEFMYAQKNHVHICISGT